MQKKKILSHTFSTPETVSNMDLRWDLDTLACSGRTGTRPTAGRQPVLSGKTECKGIRGRGKVFGFWQERTKGKLFSQGEISKWLSI
ncbi:MAG: hypothetical protein WD426_08925 [Anditalea sp.]